MFPDTISFPLAPWNFDKKRGRVAFTDASPRVQSSSDAHPDASAITGAALGSDSFTARISPERWRVPAPPLTRIDRYKHMTRIEPPPARSISPSR